MLSAHGGDAGLTDTSAAERTTKLRARLKSENAGVRCGAVIDLLHLQVDHDTKRQEIIPLVLPMLSDRARRVRWRTAYELRSWAADVPVATIETALTGETKTGVSDELKRLLARAQDEQNRK